MRQVKIARFMGRLHLLSLNLALRSLKKQEDKQIKAYSRGLEVADFMTFQAAQHRDDVADTFRKDNAAVVSAINEVENMADMHNLNLDNVRTVKDEMDETE